MPDETMTSNTSTSHSHFVAAVAQPPKSRWYCPVKGCDASFRQHTDCSRHHWTHLPEDLYQPCPFIGCDHINKPRGPSLQKHWKSAHAGFPQEVEKWDTLQKILAKNNMKLGDGSPRIMTRYTISQSPPPSTPEHIEPTHNSAAQYFHNTQTEMNWSINTQTVPIHDRHAANISVCIAPEPYYPPGAYSSVPAFEPQHIFPHNISDPDLFPPPYYPPADRLYPGLTGYFDPAFEQGLDCSTFSVDPSVPQGSGYMFNPECGTFA